MKKQLTKLLAFVFSACLTVGVISAIGVDAKADASDEIYVSGNGSDSGGDGGATIKDSVAEIGSSVTCLALRRDPDGTITNNNKTGVSERLRPVFSGAVPNTAYDYAINGGDTWTRVVADESGNIQLNPNGTEMLVYGDYVMISGATQDHGDAKMFRLLSSELLEGNFERGGSVPRTGIYGWRTTASLKNHYIETGGMGTYVSYNRTGASMGGTVAELNGSESASLYQEIDATGQRKFSWSLDYAGRKNEGTQIMAMVIGPVKEDGNYIKTSAGTNDMFQDIVARLGTDTWPDSANKKTGPHTVEYNDQEYTVYLFYGEPDYANHFSGAIDVTDKGELVFAFTAILPASGGSGNVLDNVKFQKPAEVYKVGDHSYETLESAIKAAGDGGTVTINDPSLMGAGASQIGTLPAGVVLKDANGNTFTGSGEDGAKVSVDSDGKVTVLSGEAMVDPAADSTDGVGFGARGAAEKAHDVTAKGAVTVAVTGGEDGAVESATVAPAGPADEIAIDGVTFTGSASYDVDDPFANAPDGTKAVIPEEKASDESFEGLKVPGAEGGEGFTVKPVTGGGDVTVTKGAGGAGSTLTGGALNGAVDVAPDAGRSGRVEINGTEYTVPADTEAGARLGLVTRGEGDAKEDVVELLDGSVDLAWGGAQDVCVNGKAVHYDLELPARVTRNRHSGMAQVEIPAGGAVSIGDTTYNAADGGLELHIDEQGGVSVKQGASKLGDGESVQFGDTPITGSTTDGGKNVTVTIPAGESSENAKVEVEPKGSVTVGNDTYTAGDKGAELEVTPEGKVELKDGSVTLPDNGDTENTASVDVPVGGKDHNVSGDGVTVTRDTGSGNPSAKTGDGGSVTVDDGKNKTEYTAPGGKSAEVELTPSGPALKSGAVELDAGKFPDGENESIVVNGVEVEGPAKVELDENGTAHIKPGDDGVVLDGKTYKKKDGAGADSEVVIGTDGGIEPTPARDFALEIEVPTKDPVFVGPGETVTFTDKNGKENTVTGLDVGGYFKVGDDNSVTVTDEQGTPKAGPYKDAGNEGLDFTIDGDSAAITKGTVELADGKTVGFGEATLGSQTDSTTNVTVEVRAAPDGQGAGKARVTVPAGETVTVTDAGGEQHTYKNEGVEDLTLWVGENGGVTVKDLPAAGLTLGAGATVAVADDENGANGSTLTAGDNGATLKKNATDKNSNPPKLTDGSVILPSDGSAAVYVDDPSIDSGNREKKLEGHNVEVFAADPNADSATAESKVRIKGVAEDGSDGEVTVQGGANYHIGAGEEAGLTNAGFGAPAKGVVENSEDGIDDKDGPENNHFVLVPQKKADGTDGVYSVEPEGTNSHVLVEEGAGFDVRPKKENLLGDAGKAESNLDPSIGYYEAEAGGATVTVDHSEANGGKVTLDNGSVTMTKGAGNTEDPSLTVGGIPGKDGEDCKVTGDGITVTKPGEAGGADVKVPAGGKVTIDGTEYTASKDTVLHLDEEGAVELKDGAVELDRNEAIGVNGGTVENGGDGKLIVERDADGSATVEIPEGGKAEVNGVEVQGPAKVEIDDTGKAKVKPAGTDAQGKPNTSVTVGGVTYTDDPDTAGEGSVTITPNGVVDAEGMKGTLPEERPIKDLHVPANGTLTYKDSKGNDITLKGGENGATVDIDTNGDVSGKAGDVMVKGSVDATKAADAAAGTTVTQVGDVEFDVTDRNGKPVQGTEVTVVVTDEQGNKYTGTTDKDGHVVIPDVPYGVYSVEVTKEYVGEEYTSTGSVTVNDYKTVGGKFMMDMDLTITTDVEGDMPPYVENFQNMATSQDANDPTADKIHVDIVLESNKLDETNAEEKAVMDAITDALKKNFPDGAATDFVDITITKTIYKNGETKGIESPVTRTDKLLTITFPVSAELIAKLGAKLEQADQHILVYRQHDGKVEALNRVSDQYGPKATMECYYVYQVAGNWYISLRVQKFSVYAFGVTEEIVKTNDPSQPSDPGHGYEPPVNTGVTVSKTEHGTVAVTPEDPKAGDTVTLQPVPDTGRALSELTVTDRNGNKVELKDNGDGTYSFTMPAVGVTVNAKFHECPSLRFPDLSVREWYHAFTDFVIAHTLMNGSNTGLFAPKGIVTRAEMVTVLWNMAKNAKSDAEMWYTDVAENEWYYAAIRWATEVGVVNGYKDDTFRPDQAITREEMATMLYRFEKNVQKGGFEAGWSYELPFPDKDKVQGWAKEAMSWCVRNKLFEGGETGLLKPRDKAERAALAKVLTVYMQLGGES